MGIVPRTALAVLWWATHRHEVNSMVAQAWWKLQVWGLVPRYPLQKPPSRGLEGSGGEGGGGGRRSEGRRRLHLRKASRGLEVGFKGASRGLEGGLKGA